MGCQYLYCLISPRRQTMVSHLRLRESRLLSFRYCARSEVLHGTHRSHAGNEQILAGEIQYSFRSAQHHSQFQTNPTDIAWVPFLRHEIYC